MKIDKELKDDVLIVTLEGRLDLNSAPELERDIKLTEEIKKLILDLEKIEYISSAGLRVIITLEDIMKKQGMMIIKNINDDVKEVFDITGLSEELNIE